MDSLECDAMMTPQPNSDLPQRKPLGHAGTPAEVRRDGTPTFFVTVCAESRGGEPLLPLAGEILESAKVRNARGVWFAKAAVVMPDHVHLLVTVPADTALATAIGSWKRYLARMHGARWQANFFDHRIRNADEEAEKFEYIRQNPVRRGLCATPEEWPWRFVASPADGGAMR